MNKKHTGQPQEQQIIVSDVIEQRMQQLFGAEIQVQDDKGPSLAVTHRTH